MMNVYAHELKAHWKGLLWWSLGMIFMIYAGMTKYGAYAKSGQSGADLFKVFPKGLAAVFGIGQVNLATALGFFSVLMLYLYIMAAIHASLLGAGVLTEEELDRTAEFLYAKPISRVRIVTEKLLAALTNVAVLFLVTTGTCLVVVQSFNKGPSANKGVLLLMLGVLATQLIFMALGLAAAAVFKKPKMAAPAVSGYMLAAYFISVWLDATDKYQWLKYFTPFKYFDAVKIANTIKIEFLFIPLTAAVVAVLIGMTYYFYRIRDLYV
jgi:ABC-2 type transport system permease protein